MTDTQKPKRPRLSSPEDNAVRVRKQVRELERRRAAARATRQTWDRERKLIEALTDEEREILFRLEPRLRPAPPVAPVAVAVEH